MAVADVKTVLNANEIAYYAKQAGFPAGEVALATAIAMAESGGNTRAHNTRPPDDSYGLWQINMYGSLAVARRVAFGIATNDALFDPATNARAAKMIRQGQGWSAWSVYTSGAYKKHLEAAQQAANSPTAPSGVDTPDPFSNPIDKLNPVNQINDIINKFVKVMQEQALRVAMFVGGGFLIWLGLQIFVSGRIMPAGRDLAMTVKGAVTKTKGLARK